MKRFIAVILAMIMLLGVQAGSFAIRENDFEEKEFADKGRDPSIYDYDMDSFLVNNTDIMNTEEKDTDYIFPEGLEVDRDKMVADYTEYNYRDELDLEKKQILEDAYLILDNAIDQEYGELSVYWSEADFLPYQIVFKIREFEQATGFTYLEYKDDKWQEMKHEFDEKNQLVIITVSVNGPIAICHSPGGSAAILKKLAEMSTVFDSVTGTTKVTKGSTASSLPIRIHKRDDVVTIAVDQAYMLERVNWDVFNEAYKEVKDEIPEGMTARYFFWLQEEKPSEVEFALEDIKVGDNVLVKLFDGKWKELRVEIPEDGLINVHFDQCGAILIMTDIK
ncbi:MAG: hypothetical protein Q4E35_04810 [Eubacteriales bacterium]|nr:hypothetical protein [Eubacteriales bacterium]